MTNSSSHMFLLASCDSPLVDYKSAVVYNGRQKLTIPQFRTFQDLCEKVQDHWRHLKFSDFEVIDKSSEMTVDYNGYLRPHLPKHLELSIKRKSTGFSTFKQREQEALSAIDSLFIHWCYIPVPTMKYSSQFQKI